MIHISIDIIFHLDKNPTRKYGKTLHGGQR